MRIFLIAFALTAFVACQPEKETKRDLKTGIWRASLEIQGQQLPFNFELVHDSTGGYDVYLRNAEERLLLDEVSVDQDSINIALHIFDANIKAVITGDSLKGSFIKNYEKDYRIPFRAVQGQS